MTLTQGVNTLLCFSEVIDILLAQTTYCFDFKGLLEAEIFHNVISFERLEAWIFNHLHRVKLSADEDNGRIKEKSDLFL